VGKKERQRKKRATAGTIVQAGGVVIRRQGRRLRVLVIRSSDGVCWLFPKGHVERGESAEEAATREVREEAGVDSTVRGFAGRVRYRRGTRRVEVSYYLLEYRRKVKASEDRDARWCTPGEARRLLSFEALKTVLRRAMSD
jgi:8-oxo-dGTP pyrophosphatase MutT (NUDIX family)